MEKSTLAVITTLSVCLLSTNANSASFDCKEATTWVEKAICESTELSNLDEAMAKKHINNLTDADNDEDREIYKDNAVIDQKLWLTFQRNTCKDTKCLIREYKEYIADKTYTDWNDEIGSSVLPDKNAFGEFSQTSQISIYNSGAQRWEEAGKATNTVSIHDVANKPYLSIIEGMFIFTNAHTCEIETSKATWSQNHWVINESQQDETVELRLYPATYQDKYQLLLKDVDNKYRELHCGMRGYFDGIVLKRE